MVPPAESRRAADQGWRPDLRRSVVRIREPNGRVAGTGFVVGDRLVVTCAHVVAAGNSPPDGPVSIEIPQVATAVRQAFIDAASWRPPDGDDVAFLRCDGPFPDTVRPLPLGTATEAHGHRVASFGFPANAPGDGHYGYGRAGGEIRGDSGSRLIQITECSEVTEGFSGAPVLDEVTGLVIGMVDSVATVDRLGRGGTTAYLTPTETLRSICPELTLATVCPYMGLESFSSEHAAWFFGRERAINAVLSRLRRDLRMVAMLGPSGSGKSSLINAGVVPALRSGGLPGSEQWETVTVVPAELPEKPLITVAAEARNEGRNRVVLVFDQFEQLLVTGDRERRAAVLAELAELPDRSPEVTVILVMRDDFYSRLAATAPPLMRRLEHVVVNVPAVLERDELTAIITGPAEAVGLGLEPQLAERIVSDAVAAAPPGTLDAAGAAPTALPLVEFTLTELWRRRVDGRLTHATYESLGGVTGGLADWCEHTYQSLPARLRQVAERTLTALIEPGDETSGTSPVSRRRTVTELRAIAATDAGAAGELAPVSTSRDDVDEVLRRLADARLVVTRHDPDAGEATVELSHDALIREWARLREWLEQDREFLTWHAWVEDQAARWRSTGDTAAGRDADLLLRGSALDLAVGWCESRHVRAEVTDFVEHSSRAEQHRRTRARRRVQVLSGLLLAAIALGVVAAVFAYRADEAASRAEQQAQVATSRALAVAADATFADQPDLAHLLALESLRAAPTREAHSALESALSQPRPISLTLTGHAGRALGVAFSQGGDLVATIGVDGTMRLWDRATGDPVGEPVTFVDPQADEYGDADLARGLAFSAVDEPLTGNASLLPQVALSPDGELMASSGDDGTVLLRDTTSGNPIGDPFPHDVAVHDVAFSPDGELLATAGDDDAVRLWDVTAREQVHDPIRHESLIERVAFSPEGDLLATAGDDNAVRLWDVTTGEEDRDPIRHDTAIWDLTYSPDGDLLATIDADDTVRIWDPATGEQVGASLPHDVPVLGVAFSPDGELLASSGFDGTVQVWSTAADRPLGTSLPHDGWVDEVALSPDGELLATIGHQGTLLWDTTTGHLLDDPLPDDEAVLGVAFSPDGDRLASHRFFDGAVWLWNTATESPGGAPLAHVEAMRSMAFSPDSDLLATAGDDGTVRLLGTATGDQLDTLVGHDDTVLDVAFSPDGDLLASSSADGMVRLWNPDTGEPVGEPLPHDEGVGGITFSPDGDLIASTSADHAVRLWDPATGDPVGDPLRHEDAVLEMAFSSDGDHLVTRSWDGPARLWSAAADRTPGTLLLRAEDAHDVAFSPDGDLLATAGDDGAVRLWDTATADLHGQPLSHDDAVYSVAFSPDGDLIATGTDRAVRLWNPATGQSVGDPLPHSDLVQSLVFSSDGGLLAAIDGGATVRLWAMPKTWTDHACRRAGRNLSQEEWETYLGEAQYVRTCPEFPAGPGADTNAPTADYSGLPDIFLPD